MVCSHLPSPVWADSTYFAPVEAEFGRFGWVFDPDDNTREIWLPAPRAAS
jgi:hypothetical protein